MKRLLVYIILLFLLFGPADVFAQVEILNLRHWAAPEHTRVVIDTSEEVQFTVDKSDKKIFLKLENAAILKTMPREFILHKPGITRIALFALPEDKVGIELFLTEQADANIFKLKKFQDKHYRVVVDIVLPEVEKEKSRAREEVKVSRKDKIIVIDPGHGGEDPGAIGYRGASEKDLVLEIGKKVRDILNAGKGTRAFLTRENDYYISFKKRLSIAREFGADLFISIHADAARNRTAQGSSVYCLSMGSASSEAARILARKENMADIVGGTLGEGDSNGESDHIILDMFQTNTINLSKAFGSKIISHLCRVSGIKFSNVQEAPFMVLKLPEIPAVLIETAYISNPQEERKLRSGKFQTEIAKAISGSVRDFFSLPAIAVPAPAALEDEKTSPSAAGRASEKPGAPVSEKPAPRTSVYKVKKGDTLDKIARKYQTRVAVLLRLNHMKMRDPLYVGRELKIALKMP
jgi:N-acetylmuramoyl-L-alanine amidase